MAGILRPRRWHLATIGLLWVPATAGMPIRALAPYEVVAAGFESLAGVAVEPGGAIVVTERQAGTLTRIDSSGRRRVILRGLRAPGSVAVEGAGYLLVLEQAGRRLLRLAPDGSISVVSTLRQASGMAVGPDGRVWVSMRHVAGRGDDDEEYVVARLDDSGTAVPFISGLVGVRGLAAGADAIYVVSRRLESERGRVRPVLARIPVQADGTAGRLELLMHGSLDRLEAVAIDAAGSVFVTDAEGEVFKWRRNQPAARFATRLDDPVALAFGPNGDLIVAERGHRGRLLRLLAPPPPALAVPAFTNQTPLALQGRSVARAQVSVARLESPLTPIASVMSGTGSGNFTVHVPLDANARNALIVTATGAGGAGLASSGLNAEVTHDGMPPSVVMSEPVSGVHVRGTIASSASAMDENSGVAALLWSVDGVDLTRAANPVPGNQFTATAMIAVEGLNEGPHALDAVAVDRAGNERVAGVPFVVDRTPPDTLVVSGPAADIAARTATFSVSGTDMWSTVAQLDYSWRLDGGSWSAFDAISAITLGDLSPGQHRFEVRARDRAGNEDATPAAHAFVVRSLQIRILEPAAGTVISTGSLWVRASVEGGSGDVVVRVPLPAEFQVAELTAPVEGEMVAIEVPADPALTAVTLIATDASGATAHAEVPIVVSGAQTFEPSLELWPPGGLAPLTVRFGLRDWPGAPVIVDADGDGTSEFEGLLDTGEFQVTFERAGVYLPTVRITTPDGDVLTRRGAVEVYDRAVLDARLQGVWGGFKDALRGADVQTAASFIAAERRETWAEYFSALPPGALEDIDLVFTTMTLVEVGYGGAQYEMVAERDGLLYSYSIWFRIDSEGRWRLWRF